jgi:uncharacterized protein (TIGR00290 family)
MRCVVAWSGGKDCALALERAREQGFRIDALLSIYDEGSGVVRFHGVPPALLGAQAERLGIDALLLPTRPESYETVFLDGLRQLRARGIEAIIFGNVHLADVRAWYEERTRGLGLAHVEPVWGEAPATILNELVERGVRARIVAADALRAGAAWLGREIDAEVAGMLLGTTGLDPLGEFGEYHSFVFDSPSFAAPIAHRVGERIVRETYTQVTLLAG